MNIAVFADLHGRIRLCFKLCARWQHETGKSIDLILQAGDLGAYPDTSRLDRATIKHARKDPTELGFSTDFATYRDEVAQDLSPTTCPMIFVRGNHEDHDWLDRLEKQTTNPIFPVDVYQRIFCLKTGVPYTFQKDDERITVVGIGRLGALPGEQDATQHKYIQQYEMERLYNADNLHCDILLTHDTALDFVTLNYGMEEIRLVLNAEKPTYHFHGHVGGAPTHHTDANEYTQVIKLADLHWDRQHPDLRIEHGSMGILRWHSPNDHAFSLVEDEWLNEYTAQTWATL